VIGTQALALLQRYTTSVEEGMPDRSGSVDFIRVRDDLYEVMRADLNAATTQPSS
jgi:hypothetical protein